MGTTTILQKINFVATKLSHIIYNKRLAIAIFNLYIFTPVKKIPKRRLRSYPGSNRDLKKTCDD